MSTACPIRSDAPTSRSRPLAACVAANPPEPVLDPDALATLNRRFANHSAEERVAYALEHLPAVHVLSSSFGAQSAVSLHMLTQQAPDLPVVLVDTGYLFPETYQFVETLAERLDLNLQVYRSSMSPARQEALFGERWQQGLSGLEAYNEQNKVEPMRRALAQLEAGTWFTGLRRDQASSRTDTPFVQHGNGRYKVAPIADWNDRDVYRYLQAHRLPYHPLWDQGYVSIGDTHSTVPLHQAESLEATRFDGLKRECGLHEGHL